MGTFVIAGFWIASAVLTAGWTWDALTKTYEKFPDTQADTAAGGINTTAEGQKLAESAIQKIPLVGGALEKAGQFLGSSFGTEPNLNPQQIARLQRLPAPPANYKSAVLNASSKNMQQRAMNTLGWWMKRHGYTQGDANAYLTLIGWKPVGL